MMHPALVRGALWLADSGGGGESKKSGPLGLVVILVLCVVCYFLFKSMSKHLKRVRDNPPVDNAELPTAVPSSDDPPAPPS